MKKESTNKIYMSRREAADYTGLSYHFIRKGTENGTIPFIMSGNRFLVNVPLLLKQLEERSEQECS
ncbi:MAG: excisionase family DNA-binding protein [Firmicutes bacterium]|nr:excisionase family DNA-binding protein [Bacillota bacterium]